jgi:gliding motility-associated protein GldC
MAHHKSQIRFDVELDANKVPEKIKWTATDGGVEDADAQAIMLAVWDEKTKDCLRLDLWTKEMTVDDMKRFFHQTILSMADTLDRSTGEEQTAMKMRKYAMEMAKDLKLID